MVKILGIETSCDETAAAVVTDGGEILSNIVYSQVSAHQPYGGVVPEIASRQHSDFILPTVEEALQTARCSLHDIDAFAATAGPGLIGGLIVGVMTAKSFAAAVQKPFLAINHLEGHALTARLTSKVEFPYLLLLVSGGHCQILVAESLGVYHKLGSTLDDALGEAFDKTAKMIGLPYPGGPQVEKLAQSGNAKRFELPIPLLGDSSMNFSFSGLKTAVKRTVDQLPKPLSEQDKADICASFQATCVASLRDRLTRALKHCKTLYPKITTLVVAGGVAANQYIKEELSAVCTMYGYRLNTPPIKLCTDNAAMIAWAGVEHYMAGRRDILETAPRARWPLAA